MVRDRRMNMVMGRWSGSGILSAALAFAGATPALLANHGPGTSGGGASTISGETLRAGKVSLDLRFDYTKFRGVDEATAASKAVAFGNFDSLDSALVGTVSVAVGITDDWQIGVQGGYYLGDHFVGADEDGMGGADVGTGNPKGLTDTWFTTKYRVMKGQPGNLSLLAGVKAPTGQNDHTLSNGEKLEPSSQPGTGSIDFQAGLAYSRFLTEKITLDASGVYTFRTRHNGFKVGDRADLGVALAYRLSEDIKETPNIAVFAELLGVYIGKDNESDVGSNNNSGGWTMYVSPGVRCRLGERLSVTAAVLVPVVQALNGEQVKQDYRITAGITLSF